MHYLHINSWAGHSKHPVEIVKETPKRYLIRILEDGTPLAGRGKSGKKGDEVYVPKYAVREE